MHVRFFLTSPYYLNPESNRRGGVLGSTIHTVNPFNASSHIQKKEPYETITFYGAMDKIGRKCCTNQNTPTGYDSCLIFLDDAVTFQLETVAVINNSYCAYNLYTKLIGFGSEPYEAKIATEDKSSRIGNGGVSFNVFNSSNENYMLDFSLPKSETEFNKYSYTVTDGFYDSVLNELIPYIDFLKLEKFKRVTSEIIRYAADVDKFIDNFYDQSSTLPTMNFDLTEFNLAVRMFLDDDPVLLKNKCYMEENYVCMSIFIRSVQVLTNETF